MAVHLDASDVFASATGTGLAFLEPIPDTVGVVLMPTDELGYGRFVQTNGARLIRSF